jgi:MFS family permease
LAFLPFAVATFFVAPTAGIFSARFGPKWVVTTGMALEALAIFLLSRVLAVDTSLAVLSLVLVIYGAGVGLAIAQLTNVVLSDIPPERLGVASGVNNTIRQVGASLGIAIIGAVLTVQITAAARTELDASKLLPPPIKTQIMQAVEAGSISESQFAGGSTAQGAQDSPIGKELSRLFKDSFVSGARSAAQTAAIFVFLGALSSLFIPNVMDRRRRTAVAPE